MKTVACPNMDQSAVGLRWVAGVNERIDGVLITRTPRGGIRALSLTELIVRRLGLDSNRPRNLADEIVIAGMLRLAAPNIFIATHDRALSSLARTSPENRREIAHWLDVPAELLWPDLAPQPADLAEQLRHILGTAQAFRLAIEALPVGKDIRGRLIAHLDAHIAAIEVLK